MHKVSRSTGMVETITDRLSCVSDYAGGWLCFVVSIIWIGILTGLISDIASSFGCTVQLLDSVNAITFVALGTSVPGMYKYKL